MKRRNLLIAALAAPSIVPAVALGQGTWPNKTVKFICPFAPGGGTDILLTALVFTSLLGALVTWWFRIETAGVNLEDIGK